MTSTYLGSTETPPSLLGRVCVIKSTGPPTVWSLKRCDVIPNRACRIQPTWTKPNHRRGHGTTARPPQVAGADGDYGFFG